MSHVDDTIDTPDEGGFRPSRRTVLAAAAWTVPAVIVAQAAPALAASGDPVTIDIDGKNVCKFPGNGTLAYKGYAFSFRIDNRLPCDTTVKIISLTMGGVAQTLRDANVVDPDPTCSAGSQYFAGKVVTSGQSVRLAVYTDEDTNSSSGDMVLTYSYTTCDNPKQTKTTTTTATLIGSPWTGGCRPFGYSKAQWDAVSTGCPTFTK